MRDDQWKARQTCSGCENLYCEVGVCTEQRLTSLRTFHLASASPKSIPISGVFLHSRAPRAVSLLTAIAFGIFGCV